MNGASTHRHLAPSVLGDLSTPGAIALHDAADQVLRDSRVQPRQPRASRVDSIGAASCPTTPVSTGGCWRRAVPSLPMSVVSPPAGRLVVGRPVPVASTASLPASNCRSGRAKLSLDSTRGRAAGAPRVALGEGWTSGVGPSYTLRDAPVSTPHSPCEAIGASGCTQGSGVGQWAP